VDGARGWADEFEWLTVGLVRNRQPEWVAAVALGPTAIEFPDRGAAEAWIVAGVDPANLGQADQFSRTCVSMVTVSGWTVLWADWGLVWTDEQVVRNLSQGGEFLCHSWGTGSLDLLEVARDREIVRSFDPWFRDDDPVGAPLPEESAIDWSQDTHIPGMLLLEQLSALGPLDVSLRDRPDARVFGYTF